MVTTLPTTSRTATVATETAELFTGIGFGLKLQVRWSADPAVHVALTLVPVRVPLLNVMRQFGYAPALVKTSVALPLEVSECDAAVRVNPGVPSTLTLALDRSRHKPEAVALLEEALARPQNLSADDIKKLRDALQKLR